MLCSENNDLLKRIFFIISQISEMKKKNSILFRLINIAIGYKYLSKITFKHGLAYYFKQLDEK